MHTAVKRCIRVCMYASARIASASQCSSSAALGIWRGRQGTQLFANCRTGIDILTSGTSRGSRTLNRRIWNWRNSYLDCMFERLRATFGSQCVLAHLAPPDLPMRSDVASAELRFHKAWEWTGQQQASDGRGLAASAPPSPTLAQQPLCDTVNTSRTRSSYSSYRCIWFALKYMTC